MTGESSVTRDRLQRVVMVWRSAGLGGTERRMGEVAHELEARGVAVRSIVLRRASQGRVLQMGSSPALGPGSLARMLVRPTPGTLFLAMGWGATLVMSLLALLTRTHPRVWAVRNGLDYRGGWQTRLVQRVTEPFVERYLCNSEAAAEFLRSRRVRADKITVIPSALGEEWFTQPRRESPHPGVVAMVGNARPEKNHEFGIEVFLAARPSRPLRIYTNDASRLKMGFPRAAQENIEFVEGQVLEPAQYDEIDVLLHPSLSESLPRAILEAKARGCVVLASSAGSTASVLGPEDEVMSSFEVDAWASALRRCLTRSGRHRSSGAVRVLSVPEYVNRLVECYARTE